MACIHGDVRFSEVLNLRVLASPSRLALKIGAWLVVMEISKSLNLRVLALSVEVGSDYRGLARCNSDL